MEVATIPKPETDPKDILKQVEDDGVEFVRFGSQTSSGS